MGQPLGYALKLVLWFRVSRELRSPWFDFIHCGFCCDFRGILLIDLGNRFQRALRHFLTVGVLWQKSVPWGALLGNLDASGLCRMWWEFTYLGIAGSNWRWFLKLANWLRVAKIVTILVKLSVMSLIGKLVLSVPRIHLSTINWLLWFLPGMPDLIVRGIRVSNVFPYFVFFDLVDGILN